MDAMDTGSDLCAILRIFHVKKKSDNQDIMIL